MSSIQDETLGVVLCLRGGTQDLQPPVKSELTLSSEEIHVVLELEFEHVVLTDIITWVWSVDIVAQQRKAGQREIILKCFVEVQTEISEDHPEFLPSVGVLELPEEIP